MSDSDLREFNAEAFLEDTNNLMVDIFCSPSSTMTSTDCHNQEEDEYQNVSAEPVVHQKSKPSSNHLSTILEEKDVEVSSQANSRIYESPSKSIPVVENIYFKKK